MKNIQSARPRSKDEVLNFSTHRELVEQTEFAAEERRSRANLIEKLLAEAIDQEAQLA